MWLILGCALIYLYRAVRTKDVVEMVIAVLALILWLLQLSGRVAGPPPPM